MATGAHHYAEAEKCLGRLPDLTYGSDEAREQLLEAHVRATLALAAATALSENGSMPGADFDAWAKVAGADPAPSGPLTVWWLDDGGESPEPELYATEAAARQAAVDAWKTANPFTEITNLEWLAADSSIGDPHTDAELNINHHYTGHVVRARRPKAAADA